MSLAIKPKELGGSPSSRTTHLRTLGDLSLLGSSSYTSISLWPRGSHLSHQDRLSRRTLDVDSLQFPILDNCTSSEPRNGISHSQGVKPDFSVGRTPQILYKNCINSQHVSKKQVFVLHEERLESGLEFYGITTKNALRNNKVASKGQKVDSK